MDMVKVESSNVAELGHDAERNILRVVFRGGGIYEYANVDAEKFTALMSSESKGRFIHQELVKQFERHPAAKIEPEVIADGDEPKAGQP